MIPSIRTNPLTKTQSRHDPNLIRKVKYMKHEEAMKQFNLTYNQVSYLKSKGK